MGASKMSQLNPYASYLDGRPIETILAETPATLSALIQTLGPARSAQPLAPGKWSPAQILAHLADCELVFGFRLRQTVAEDAPTIQPFDQDKWARTYSDIEAAQALAAFTALRGWNLQFLRTVLPGASSRTMNHPERGTMTFQTVIETMAGHDRNHLEQLRKIAG